MNKNDCNKRNYDFLMLIQNIFNAKYASVRSYHWNIFNFSITNFHRKWIRAHQTVVLRSFKYHHNWVKC